jgi:Domain of unknown function (DUF5122) beta-propeller
LIYYIYIYSITRLDANGRLETSFGANGSVTVGVVTAPFKDYPSAAAIDSQGRLVVVGQSHSTKKGCGYFQESQDTILRFTTSGQLDTSFGAGGEVDGPLAESTFDGWGSLLINPDNSIAVSGKNTSQLVIATYSSTGSPRAGT